MTYQVPEDARLEIKFAAYEVELHRLLHWLRLHAAGFFVPFPNRHVNNIYFDTHHHAAFAENLSGASSRTKVRYRWYGQSVPPDAGVLEVKRKRNYFGWKLRYPVENAPYTEDASWQEIHNLLRGQLPHAGKVWLQSNPVPVLINRYYRRYFLSSNGKVRATVDTRQAVWDQRFKPYPNFDHRANLPRTLVVEFKFARNDRNYASSLLQGMPLRVSRHSKYINGVRVISGR